MKNLNRFEEKLKSLPCSEALWAIQKKLASKKRVCWLAGGIVRDFLLDRSSNDVDLVTNATAEEIKELFPEAILVGQSFGVYKIPVTNKLQGSPAIVHKTIIDKDSLAGESRANKVMDQAADKESPVQSRGCHPEAISEGLKTDIIDLTFFREEDGYFDGRHPESIKPSTPEKDAGRRDFTINALFWDLENKKIVDYYSGFEDLKNKKLKAVGDAEVRFAEDSLRVLRLARFAAQLQFSIDDETLKSAYNALDKIVRVSGERILQEISKIKDFEVRQAFWRLDLTQKIFSTLDLSYKYCDFFNVHNVHNVHIGGGKAVQDGHGDKGLLNAGVSVSFCVLAELFLMMGADQGSIEKIKNRLKLSKKQTIFLGQILRLIEIKNKNLVDLKEEQFVFELLVLWDEAEAMGGVIRWYLTTTGLKNIYSQLQVRYQKRPPKALVRASELIGKVSDKKIGEILKAVRRKQLANPDFDRKKALIFVENY